MPPHSKVHFKWELSFGHIVQIVLFLIALVGIYYQVIHQIDTNKDGISDNAKAISQMKEAMVASRKDLLYELRKEGEAREARFLGHIGELKDDVGWLVRREVEKSGN